MGFYWEAKIVFYLFRDASGGQKDFIYRPIESVCWSSRMAILSLCQKKEVKPKNDKRL